MDNSTESPWTDEMQGLPAANLPVYISVVRRAQRVSDGEGGYRWELMNAGPIDLETDTVHWMPIPPKTFDVRILVTPGGWIGVPLLTPNL